MQLLHPTTYTHDMLGTDRFCGLGLTVSIVHTHDVQNPRPDNYYEKYKKQNINIMEVMVIWEKINISKY